MINYEKADPRITGKNSLLLTPGIGAPSREIESTFSYRRFGNFSNSVLLNVRREHQNVNRIKTKVII